MEPREHQRPGLTDTPQRLEEIRPLHTPLQDTPQQSTAPLAHFQREMLARVMAELIDHVEQTVQT
jgi:hypothetical protein